MGQYGSLVNHLVGTSKQPVVPEVGMGATQILWSDRHAYTIIEVRSPREIVVQSDNAKRADNNGISDSQQYEYEPNPRGTIYEVTLRSNGTWVTKGQGYKSGTRWWIGIRDEHYDFSF